MEPIDRQAHLLVAPILKTPGHRKFLMLFPDRVRWDNFRLQLLEAIEWLVGVDIGAWQID